MGGKVLDYESKHIYNDGLQAGRNEGRSEGLREGRSEGRSEGLREGQNILLITMIEGMMERHNMSLEEVCSYMGIKPEDYTKAKSEVEASNDQL